MRNKTGDLPLRPRGLYDCELPFVPYTEVVSYEELENGELKLFVEAVSIKKKQIVRSRVNWS